MVRINCKISEFQSRQSKRQFTNQKLDEKTKTFLVIWAFQSLTFLSQNNYIIFPMLTQQLIRELEIDSPVFVFSNKPKFTDLKQLWVKSQLPLIVTPEPKCSKKFEFKKHGKVFGFEIRRYIAIRSNYLVYFEKFDDDRVIGYCNLQNVYAYFLNTKSKKRILYLTNGTQSSHFYFKNDDFFSFMLQQVKTIIIQLNYKQKYSAIDFLGEGNFSRVYLSRRNSDSKLFASKFVSKLDKNGFCNRSWVETEKKILGKLAGCQYICKLEEFYEDNNDYIFILQYLSGTDLNTFLKERACINSQDKIILIKRLLEGIQYCHKNNIMHRDLKPENIVIDKKTMKPKIIDFGLSLIMTENQITDFSRCGTNGYMAPQIAALQKNQIQKYDQKCDIFSLGVIAHIILLGYNPLKGKNYQETLKKSKQCSFSLQKQKIISKYGQQCYKLLNSLLSKSSTKRPSATTALQMNIFSNTAYKDSSQSTTQKQDSCNEKRQNKQVKILKMNCTRLMGKQS